MSSGEGDTQGTEEDQGRDGGTTLIVSEEIGIVSRKTWFTGGQWGRPTSNDGHSTAETETESEIHYNNTQSFLEFYSLLHKTS